mgnify:CR=1 FL=1
MAVRIRMKKLGRTHRPFFRVCATDARSPRDGRVIEELGTYDPMLSETDARAVLNGERIDYWLSVGAQPSENVKTLIKKYGTNGTHLEAQQAALERLATNKPTAPAPVVIKAPEPETPAEEAAADESPAEDAAAEAATDAEASAASDAPAAEAPAEEASAEAAGGAAAGGEAAGGEEAAAPEEEKTAEEKKTAEENKE